MELTVLGPVETHVTVEFRLLGPMTVSRGGQRVPLARGKQRALLATLLLRHGEVVSVDELAEVLWGDDPPTSARVTVQNYVMRLRSTLGEAGRDLRTEPGGYLLRVPADQLDVSRFEALTQAASAAARAGNWHEASAKASLALDLWRGAPLADVEACLLQARERPRLEELRRQALEVRIEAELRLGDHQRVITELAPLIAAAPLRERLHGLLMQALHASGQQAEALAAYERARQTLIAELGTEPGAALQELHLHILTGEPAVSPARPNAAGHVAGPPVPRELPADVAAFTGRAAELAALDQILLGTRASHARAGEGTTAAVISAVSGTAGVGKTALALRWAHQAAPHFPDGQLHVNLRGYDPAQPLTASDALAGFLRSLGVPGEQIPPEEDERAARYRSLLAGKRMLILLDNASTVDQVRPLLPGHPECRVVVTSRDSLAGLIARDGARRLDLDLLPVKDAAALLRELIGERAAADPAAVAELAEHCGRLPLALRVAAELAVSRPADSLTRLVADLKDEQRRLDLLSAHGDPRTAVRAVFAWSYQHLDEDTARAFRLAGLHLGADFEPYAVAALTGSELREARRAIDTLNRAHLVHAAAPGRYAMHDLLRAYARALSGKVDGPDEEQAALSRLFNHYVHASAAAMDVFHPAERYRRPRIPAPPTPVPPFADPAQALAWLDGQRDCLVTTAQYAADHGRPWVATRLSATLYRYLDLGSHCADARAVHACALRSARQCGDRTAEGVALNALGGIDLLQGRYQQAGANQRAALAAFVESGDRANQAHALNSLGNVAHHQGAYQAATARYEQALALYRETGHRNGQAVVLSNLGAVLKSLGRYQHAIGHYQQALALYRQTGNRHGEAIALSNIGSAYERQGSHQEAAEFHQEALGLHRAMGNRNGEAIALNNLGTIERHRGRYPEAIALHQRAFTMHCETGDRSMQAAAINNLGLALLSSGETRCARTQYAAALDIASQIGDKYEQGRAHAGLGDVGQADGEIGPAIGHWQQALALFTELGVPEAAEVQPRLSAAASSKAGSE